MKHVTSRALVNHGSSHDYVFNDAALMARFICRHFRSRSRNCLTPAVTARKARRTP